jgi:hypothetical protein
MRRVRLFLSLLSLLVFCFSRGSSAQLWSGILAPTRAVDWSNAGATITNRTSICATFNPGATAAQIQTQLQNAACSGKVVLLNAGIYNLSAGIDFGGKSNVTLRGAGADQTFLVFSSDTGCGGLRSVLCIEGHKSLFGKPSDIAPDNTASWTATSYAKGQTQITLTAIHGSLSNLQLGRPMVIDQCNDGLSGHTSSSGFGGCATGSEADSGSTWICSQSSGACANASLDGPSGGSRPSRDQAQIVTVTNIAGNVVTFSPGLYMPNWNSARSPEVYWSSSPNTGVGVEDLSIDFTSAGTNSGIAIWNCYNCWVKGIRSVYSTHDSSSQRNHIFMVLSPHATVRDSYFFGSASLHSEGYGVECFGAGDDLIENNIFQNMPSPQMLNSFCSGTVVGYNYSINDANDVAYLFNSLTLHAPVDNTLAEGNIGNSYRGDKFHGSHNFNRSFRNYYKIGRASCRERV